MEKQLPNIIGNIKQNKKRMHDIKTLLLRPTELLAKLGVDEFDELPIEAGKFYTEQEARDGRY
jgi:hypothetical protein